MRLVSCREEHAGTVLWVDTVIESVDRCSEGIEGRAIVGVSGPSIETTGYTWPVSAARQGAVVESEHLEGLQCKSR